MKAVFLQVIRMSLSAFLPIAALLGLRLVFKKGPAYIRGILWLVVAFRLICPVRIPVPYSFLPEREALFQTVEDVLPEGTGASAALSGQRQDFREWESSAACAVWLSGMGALAAWGIGSWLLLKRKMGTAVMAQKGIYLTEQTETPFVMGIVRPRIYLPFGMEDEQQKYVLLHERIHIKHRHNLIKPIFYAVLCIHWFNPLVWMSWHCLNRDLELICDESAVRQLDSRGRREYAQTLFSCSLSGKKGSFLRSAFGGGDMKQRVKKILSYRKPGWRIKAAAACLCLTAAVCLLPWGKPAGQAEAKTLYSMTGRGTQNEPIIGLHEAAEIICNSVERMPNGGISLKLPEGRYAQGEWKAEICRLYREEKEGDGEMRMSVPCWEKNWDGGWRTGASEGISVGGFEQDYAGLRISVFHTENGDTAMTEKDVLWEQTDFE